MVIVCSGPDTYRARERARELVEAFRKKHDPQGFSTEIVDGSEGLQAVVSRLGSGSLFSTKKCIRADGIIDAMKIAEVRTLAAKLAQDKDQTILVTVEEEPPNEKTLDALKLAPLFHYPHPLLGGAAFRKWIVEQAGAHGVSERDAERIAEYAEGDAWLAVSELQKQSVHSSDVHVQRKTEQSVFDLAESILTREKGWREMLASSQDDNAISIFLSQARAALRVRDGYTDGLHPYVVKKLLRLKIQSPDRALLSLHRIFLSSRSGLASGKEVETLF